MIKVLLIDHGLDHPRSVSRLMAGLIDFEFECGRSYSHILTAFRNNRHDVCLIDSSTDNGLRLFNQARSVGCYLPIVLVIPNEADEAIRAMRSGVADCLIREDLTPVKITQSICYVGEQSRTAHLQAQRERRYLALLENASEIVYSHDLRGNLTSLNRTGERMMGYLETDIVNMNLSQIVVPEYQPIVWEMIARTMDAQSQMAEDVELFTKHNNTLPVRVTTHPIQLDGTTSEIQAIARPSPVLTKPRRHNQTPATPKFEVWKEMASALRVSSV